MASDPEQDALRSVAKSARRVDAAVAAHEDTIVDAYAAVGSIEKLSAATETERGAGRLSPETVRQLLRRKGVQLRRRGRPTKETTT